MAGVNKVIILGNLGRDPEIRETPGGSVCALSIATSRSYTDKSGKRHEETEWHRVSVWGKQGENCQRFLAKGRQVYVEGRLHTRSYDDKDGKKRWATDIVADTVQFIGGRGEGGGSDEQRGRAARPPANDNATRPFDDTYAPSDPGDDDIPF